MTDSIDDITEQLRAIEDRLRDLAFDRLREAADGDEDARQAEKRLQQARRAVERAIRALGGSPDTWS
jgi:septation ring formation regulator EzrA